MCSSICLSYPVGSHWIARSSFPVSSHSKQLKLLLRHWKPNITPAFPGKSLMLSNFVSSYQHTCLKKVSWDTKSFTERSSSNSDRG